MSFTLPDQYKDFVTSAEDLLQQFSTAHAADSVMYEIYPDICTLGGASVETLNALVELHHSIKDLTTRIACDYVWHKDPFKLYVSCDQSSCKSILCLSGCSRYGDCIDDEWFIVYLLLRISEEHENLSIKVHDSDGQFLLMEAADSIDEWLGPENSNNRVWIRKGKILIIPWDEPGRTQDGHMDLMHALHGIKHSDLDFSADSAVQRTVYARTTRVYPAQIKAMSHRVACILPAKVAHLLLKQPTLLARSIEAFHYSSKDKVRNVSSSAVGKALLGRCDVQELAFLSLPLTRALFAQLMFKTFHPPRKYHRLMRRAAAAGSIKVSRAFDIGCRILCGLECAYAESLQVSPEASTLRGLMSETGITKFATLSDLITGLGPNSREYENIICKLRGLADCGLLSFNADPLASKPPDSYEQDISVLGKPLHTVIDAGLDVDHSVMKPPTPIIAINREDHSFRSFHAASFETDSEAWLFMSPEELDAELQQRMAAFQHPPPPQQGQQQQGQQQSTSDSGTNNYESGQQAVRGTGMNASATLASGASASFAPDAMKANDTIAGETTESGEMQSLIDGIKSFLAGESEFDGVVCAAGHGSKSHQQQQQHQHQHQHQQSGIAKTLSRKHVHVEDHQEDQGTTVPNPALSGLTVDLGVLGKLLSDPEWGLQTNTVKRTTPNPVGTQCGIQDVKSKTEDQAEEQDLLRYFSRSDMDLNCSDDDSVDDPDADCSDSRQTPETLVTPPPITSHQTETRGSCSTSDGRLGNVFDPMAASADSFTAVDLPPLPMESTSRGSSAGYSTVACGVFTLPPHGAEPDEGRGASKYTVPGGHGRKSDKGVVVDGLRSHQDGEDHCVEGGGSGCEGGDDDGFSSRDSDDEDSSEESYAQEKESTEGSLSEDEFMSDYQRAMDIELLGNQSLSQTFEWRVRGDRNQAQSKAVGSEEGNGEDEDDEAEAEVDEELTLVKNLLEAQTQVALGGGMPGMEGPLAQLLTHMGLAAPTAPPKWTTE